MRVALLFTDGVGIGRRDPEVNPLARGRYLLSQFEGGEGEPLPAGGALHPVDACFGVSGRPQSASNQTALLTGEPAPALRGRHVLGYPDAALRALLAERSIVKRLKPPATFANAYPAGYLDALGVPRRPAAAAEVIIPPKYARRLKASASTLAFAAGGVALRTLDDARAGLGLTNDIDGERAEARGLEVPRRTPEEAAAVLWRIASGHTFTMFEHYLADEAGHARDFPAALAAIEAFDRFCRAAIATRPADCAVLITSDHGNVEDLSSRNHTRNPVAVLAFGVPAAAAAVLRTVADVGKLVLALAALENGGA